MSDRAEVFEIPDPTEDWAGFLTAIARTFDPKGTNEALMAWVDKMREEGPPEAPESSADILTRMGTDAMKWAQEFTRIMREEHIEVRNEDFEGFMLGWFANAIGAGEMEQYAKIVDWQHAFPTHGVWVCDRCGQLLDKDGRGCYSGTHVGPGDGEEARGRAIHTTDLAAKLQEARDTLRMVMPYVGRADPEFDARVGRVLRGR